MAALGRLILISGSTADTRKFARQSVTSSIPWHSKLIFNHRTSRVHEILAPDIAKFLSG